MKGTVGILNVGEGDVKLSFDKSNPAERKRAAEIVKDMIRNGYAVMIEVGTEKGDPVYRRAKDFDPKTCEYIIMGGPDEKINLSEPQAPSAAVQTPRRGRPPRTTRIPAESTRSVSVSRSAGGYDPDILSRLQRGASLKDQRTRVL